MNPRRLPPAQGALLFGLLGVLFAMRPACAVTPAQYDQALGRVQAALSGQAEAVRHGTALPPERTPQAVAERVLVPILFVERPGQPPQTVDDSLLLASLKTVGRTGDSKHRIADLQTVSGQIDTLRHDITLGATKGEAPRGFEAEQAAKSVLSGRLYSADPLPSPSLLDRFSDWLSREIDALFKRLAKIKGPSSGPSFSMPNISLPFVRGLVILLAAGAFAVLVVVLVQWLRRRPARASTLALDETEAALVEARDTDSLRALAEAQAHAGDYRRAFRLIYIATLVALDTGGILRFDRSKTNWEYLRALRAAGRGDVYEAMTPLTREFDRLWYGFAAAEASDYMRALAQYDAFQAAQSAPPGRSTTVVAR